MAYTAADLNAEIILVMTASITKGIASLSPKSWHLRPSQYLFKDSSALKKFNETLCSACCVRL